jgi:peptidyl-prolyl cis-trans isomerase A (cyclophilin A)
MSHSTDVPRVTIAIECGAIIIEVDLPAAPITGQNFLSYAEDGLYDNSSFFRIVAPCNQAAGSVKIDVIQGGLSEDMPSPLRPIEHESTRQTGLRHLDGTVSMTRRALGSASGSFFICVGDQPELDFGGHRHPDGQGFAAFGRVIEGMEVVRSIWRRAEGQAMLMRPVRIASAKIMGGSKSQ